MKKVRIWYRERRKRWYGEYWLHGKRIAKAFSSKREANLWKCFMSYTLNYENWQGVTGLRWVDAIHLYFLAKEAQDIADGTRFQIENTFKHFDKAITIGNTEQLCQQHIELYIRTRMETVGNRSVNKDLENLRAFHNWLVKNHYNNQSITWTMLKTINRPFIPPTTDQLISLFNYAKACPSLYARMVLALALGVRRSAVESITLLPDADCRIDLDTGIVYLLEIKTKEIIAKRLGDKALQKIIDYISTLPDKNTRLFSDVWDGKVRQEWEKGRKKAGLPNFHFHHLRNMSVSLLADKGESSMVLQKHLGHKNIKTTEGYAGIGIGTEKRLVSVLDDVIGGL
ncbi:hypothetical protein LCGC14_2113010 [marine sediment metagenome]|uniref:Tyr recombinase domain-containing protein n=1 Tax=marine sediment metagenome TaxID=412755 RepID=A0A0F9E6L3_9ZZZZ